MRVQSQEEYGHAMKFYNYLLEARGKISFMQIEAPKVGWRSAEEVYQDTFKHEQKVTESIYKLVDQSIIEKITQQIFFYSGLLRNRLRKNQPHQNS